MEIDYYRSDLLFQKPPESILLKADSIGFGRGFSRETDFYTVYVIDLDEGLKPLDPSFSTRNAECLLSSDAAKKLAIDFNLRQTHEYDMERHEFVEKKDIRRWAFPVKVSGKIVVKEIGGLKNER